MVGPLHHREHTYDVNGQHIHTVSWPNPSSTLPPLLILHGIGDSAATFAAVATRFAAQRTVYALDLRGHGASSKPATGYAFSDYAADVRGVLAQLPAPSIHLLGHSLGALVAIHVAAAPGPPVTRLVLEDPPLILDWGADGIGGLMHHLLALKRQPLPEVIAGVAADFPALDAAWHHASAQALINAADGPFRALVDGEQPPVAWAALLARITMPTLVLVADPILGSLVDPAQRALLRDHLPAARLLDFTGCNHQIEAACPDAFVAAVEAFLNAPA